MVNSKCKMIVLLIFKRKLYAEWIFAACIQRFPIQNKDGGTNDGKIREDDDQSVAE